MSVLVFTVVPVTGRKAVDIIVNRTYFQSFTIYLQKRLQILMGQQLFLVGRHFKTDGTNLNVKNSQKFVLGKCSG